MTTSSFVDVTTGNATVASNVNQLVDAFNGTVAAQASFLSPANTTTPIFVHLPSKPPSSDLTTVQSDVTGDTAARIGFYIRSSDGYGGVRGGVGAAITAHLYATASGWAMPEALAVAGALSAGSLSVSGSSPFALANPTGITLFVGPTLPTSGMRKWDVAYKTSFS